MRVGKLYCDKETADALEAIRALGDQFDVDEEFSKIVKINAEASFKVASELAYQMKHVLAATARMAECHNIEDAIPTVVSSAVEVANADRASLFCNRQAA